MAYQTYITDALVCGSKNSNTSDKAYLLFSREAGMVWASARSVREERSKQRFALQDFSLLRATLVRGKGGWKIAGVEPIRNLFFEARDRFFRGTVRNGVRLLRRVMQGETPHPELFDDVIDFLTNRAQGSAEDFELILSLRVLHALGYVAPHETYNPFLEESHKNLSPAALTQTERNLLIKTITEALTTSHL